MKEKAYCVKCRETVAVSDYQYEHDKRGRPRLHGVCPHCHTHVYKYVSLAKRP